MMPEYSMNTKVAASTSGMAIATTRPARRPRLRKLTTSTITTASNSARGEAADRLLDDRRLVGDQVHADADRQVGHDLRHALPCRPSPNSMRLLLAFMPMAMPIAGWPLKRNIGCGGST